jgi:hypothetical protein
MMRARQGRRKRGEARAAPGVPPLDTRQLERLVRAVLRGTLVDEAAALEPQGPLLRDTHGDAYALAPREALRRTRSRALAVTAA